ncbi:hypothetical protein HZH68_008480 [Vespula germanica]|uniref:Uncharacterized protein n=1 Tax=Vespula germanica TaxID=30212 RepID=A0A834JZA6_VESGE|nr:hypothetical protein HZH68_008480 [Vespula germanica]
MFAGKSELSREGKAGVGQHLRARKIRRAYPAERGKWNRITFLEDVTYWAAQFREYHDIRIVQRKLTAFSVTGP